MHPNRIAAGIAAYQQALHRNMTAADLVRHILAATDAPRVSMSPESAGTAATKRSSRVSVGTEIKIAYKYVDGMHFFVPDDKEAAGLCVAHENLETAWEEVNTQLTVLFRHLQTTANIRKPTC
jgi:hypothetical protein